MADVPKGQSCKNCAKKDECKRKKIAVWCIWYKPKNIEDGRVEDENNSKKE